MKEEYYIQGSPARAEEIKAAFEAKGIDTTGNSVGDEDWLYFSSNGLLYFEEFSNTLLNIFKTHPGYTELPLPVKPKFNAWDWVVSNGQPAKIYELKQNYYLGKYLNGHDFCHKYADEDKLHLWTIADAKDGDVLIDTLSGTRAVIILFRGINADDSINAYCGWNGYTFRVTTNGAGYGTLSSTRYVPATKEQRDLLFSKMQEAGYHWDEEKKELKKIPKKHYDISSFHAGMPVLVRADNVCRWDYSVFSRITGNEDWPFAVCNGVSFTQCIPFNKETKHLLGTTDMCEEKYINW